MRIEDAIAEYYDEAEYGGYPTSQDDLELYLTLLGFDTEEIELALY